MNLQLNPEYSVLRAAYIAYIAAEIDWYTADQWMDAMNRILGVDQPFVALAVAVTKAHHFLS